MIPEGLREEGLGGKMRGWGERRWRGRHGSCSWSRDKVISPWEKWEVERNEWELNSSLSLELMTLYIGTGVLARCLRENHMRCGESDGKWRASSRGWGEPRGLREEWRWLIMVQWNLQSLSVFGIWALTVTWVAREWERGGKGWVLFKKLFGWGCGETRQPDRIWFESIYFWSDPHYANLYPTRLENRSPVLIFWVGNMSKPVFTCYC